MSAVTFKRTSTGILSNRRPVSGTTADSGTTTPEDNTPRLSLLANAKREAAKRGLYSRFFRGPVLGPENTDGLDGPSQAGPSQIVTSAVSESFAQANKRKSEVTPEDSVERRERKRLKKERKEAKKAAKAAKAKDMYNASTVVEEVDSEEKRKARRERKREEKQKKNRAEEIAKPDSAGLAKDDEKKRKGKRKATKTGREEKGPTSTELEGRTEGDHLTSDTLDVAVKQKKRQRDTNDEICDSVDRNTSHKKKRKRHTPC